MVLADDNLQVAGRTFEGFPLLLNDECLPMEPAQTYLWTHLTSSGRIQSKSTWVKYGRALYDFFAFCEINEADWRARPEPGHPSAIEWYRDWSLNVVKLNTRTINQRLRMVEGFYKWALIQRHIHRMPFGHQSVRTFRPAGFFAHVVDTKGSATTARFLLKELKEPVRFLTAEQVRVGLAALTNYTHKLMFELMVRTGLRQVECRTFPMQYVFDPAKRKDLAPGRLIPVWLDPRDMHLKYGRRRRIDIPYSLMEDLWWYAVQERQTRAAKGTDETPELFLTKYGEPYKEQSLTEIYTRLERNVGFHVRPHMLRHTYATYSLSTRRNCVSEGEALMYVRDRMGHRSVSTTSIYLHVVNSMDSKILQQFDDEMDELFAIAPHG